MSGTLDFIVIGAQKAATTSLWRCLQTHPELYMPPSKEAPFFSLDVLYARGFEWYLGDYFAGAPGTALWGTVTPQYMMGSAEVGVAEIARRIHEAVPEVRLIAMLRDPIERARSQHRMSVHRGTETRSFEVAAREQLEPAALAAAREAPTELNSYVTQGEYGRLLSVYLGHVPRERLLVVRTDELEQRPAEAVRAVLRFLGVDEEHASPELGRRHHRGGTRRRIDLEAETALREYLGTHVWPETRRPREQHRAFDFWLREWLVVPDDDLPRLDPAVRAALEQHFAADAARLESETGTVVPWSLSRRQRAAATLAPD